MGNLLESLKELCDKNKLTQKILIMPSYPSGHELVSSAARQDIKLINLKVETIRGLAQKRCEAYMHSNRLQLLKPTTAKILVSQILNELKEKNELKYFNKLQFNPGFVKAVYNSLNELRMEGYSSKDLDEAYFVNHDKYEDIKLISKLYENSLKKLKYLDEFELYKLAMTFDLKESDKVVYIMPFNLKAKGMELKYVYFISQKNVNIIGEVKKSLIEKEGLNINIVRAYGVSNEVKAVIRDIKANKINFDKILIAYTIKEPYTQLFYSLAQKLELPVSFEQGIAINNTKVGKLYFSLLDWITDNFKVDRLFNILRNGYLSLDDDAPSSSKIIRLLRKSKIGWDRERYIKGLDNLINEINIKIEKEADVELLKVYKEDALNIKWIKGFIESLLNKISKPNEDNKIDIKEFSLGMYQIIDQYSKIKTKTKTESNLNAEAKRVILDELSEINKFSNGLMDFDEACVLLKDTMEGLSVGTSSSKPGHIHITSYRNGIFVKRDNTYIVGLSSFTFPGQTIEDPILLDNERIRISEKFPLNKSRVLENQEDMFNFYNEAILNIDLSFSFYDTIENRMDAPCSFVLQVYRNITNDANKDYEELNEYLKNIAGYIPSKDDRILDCAELWLKKKEKDKILLKAKDIFNANYKNINNGKFALEQRLGEKFTEYDGKIHTKSCSNTFSASQLETLAKCPFLYFLKHLLGVKPPEDMEYDSEQWLNALEKGNLLHKIFELYYKKIVSSEADISRDLKVKIINDIAKEQIEIFKNEIAPPNKVVFEHEEKDVYNACEVFIFLEEENKTKPEYFEFEFGMNSAVSKESVEIKLNNGGTICLKGKIDRIDSLGNDKYKLIDYKTGGTYGFDEGSYFSKGTHLQHALYSIAFEKILKKENINSEVTDFLYMFPTIKGEGQIIKRSKDKRDTVLDLLEKLLSIINGGAFIMTDNDSNCKFCDYQVICNESRSKDVIKELIKSCNDCGIGSYRGVLAYE